MTSSDPQEPVGGPPPAPASYALPQPYPAPCGSAYPSPPASTPPEPSAPVPPVASGTVNDAPAPSDAVPPPGYAYPAPPASPPTNGSAIAGFILAILSFLILPVVLAIVALVLSVRGLAAIESDPGGQSGRGLAVWGRGLAIANLVLFGLVGLFLAAVGVGLLIGSR